MQVNKIHFLNAFQENCIIPKPYKSLHYNFNKKPFYLHESTNATLKSNDYNKIVITYIAFPKFLIPTFDDIDTYGIKRIIQKNQICFGIIITPEIKNINEYLNNHFSKNSKAPIIKKMKRLESCFNISYKVFYGNIEKEYYDFLMNNTYAMLTKRFEQRNDTNHILINWERYKNILFPLINEKKASIFVIYNNESPIQISINFHYGKTFFAHIPAYDVDYAPYGLGNTAVYKQLEWCIENNYEYLDMGNGYLEYKKRWCNYQYDLETHIFYKKTSIIARALAFKETNEILLKNIAKDLLNSTTIKRIKNFYKTKINTKILFPNYNIEKIEPFTNTLALIKIDLKKNHEFDFINQHVYNFIYTYKEHFDSVSVYKIPNETESFIVKGKDNSIKVIFNK